MAIPRIFVKDEKQLVYERQKKPALSFERTERNVDFERPETQLVFLEAKPCGR